MSNESKLIRVTGLWKTKTKQAGKTMLSGQMGGECRVIILPNDRKQNEREPDYVLFFAPSEGQGQGGGERSGGDL